MILASLTYQVVVDNTLPSLFTYLLTFLFISRLVWYTHPPYHLSYADSSVSVSHFSIMMTSGFFLRVSIRDEIAERRRVYTQIYIYIYIVRERVRKVPLPSKKNLPSPPICLSVCPSVVFSTQPQISTRCLVARTALRRQVGTSVSHVRVCVCSPPDPTRPDPRSRRPPRLAAPSGAYTVRPSE